MQPMLLRLAYLGVTNALAMLRLLPPTQTLTSTNHSEQSSLRAKVRNTRPQYEAKSLIGRSANRVGGSRLSAASTASG
jgi:hypothetical protein